MNTAIENVINAKEYPPTAEQLTFIETVTNHFYAPRSQRSIIVAAAVAGAGKTATCLDIYNVLTQDLRYQYIQLVAFNVDAKKELVKRGVSPKHAKTLNGLGYANLLRFAKSRGLKPVLDVECNLDKMTHCLRQADPELFKLSPVRKFAKSLMGFCKAECKTKFDRATLEGLASHYEVFIDVTPEELEELDISLDELERQGFAWVAKAMEINNRIPASGEWLIDFNDQVYLTVIHKVQCFQNDLMIVDEAQDLSVADKKLVHACLKSNGILVLVGDDYQCIYAWRGCHVNNLQKTVGMTNLNVIETPLTYNFRSCEEIIEGAQQDCPHIQCGTGRHGSVETAPLAEFKVTELSGDVAVLSRTRAPLVGYAIECLKADVAFSFRMSLKFLSGFVSQVSDGKADLSIRAFNRRLNAFAAARAEQYRFQDAEQALEELNDNVAILETIIEKNLISTDTVGDLLLAIGKLDKEIQKADGGIKLSTMHGSKGLEWDETYLIGFADIGKNCYKDWKQTEARNLRLVARTRAKNRIVFLEG